jgi:transcriptional regulator with XRE-family HTH domain
MNDIGKVVRDIRTSAGMTQRELAKRLRCTNIYVCYVERGRYVPSFRFLRKLEKVTGVDFVLSYRSISNDT